MRWLDSPVDADAARLLARELKVSPLIARLLVQRGLAEPAAAQAFLHPSLGQLHPPELMAGMREAVARLRRALEHREKILIYGDYDVDGTMAVVVLLTALRMLGAEVEAYVPHRLTDGYGMRAPVVEEAAANGFRVVISVDTGIREHAVLARARELGVDCIVTDHHLPDVHLPPACAILNPLRADCGYPEKSLAGVGVAFKLAQALLGERLTARLLQSFLKVVAIGTIADVVPLLGENRIIARFGLEGLRQPAQSGLAALIEFAGLAGKEISAGDVGFRLAPRLNAAGRMENARDVIDLFTLPDAARTRPIAERLDRLNRERQRVEEEILRTIVAQLQQRDDLPKQFTLVLAGEGWHRGVIGIVAQRVVERYHRPALVIGIEDGMGVGSGRSIKSFHLLEALTSVGDLFQRFGGHAQAAGFVLRVEQIPELTRRFEQHARSILAAPDLEPVLRVDAPLDLAEVGWPLYEEIIQLEPFGMGNPTPVFGACGIRLLAAPRILQEKHLKLRVGKGVRTLDALGWGWAARTPSLEAGQQVDLAFTLERNNYQDMASLQLILKDLVATGEIALGRARRQKWMTGLVVGGLSLMALAVALTYWGRLTRHTAPARNLPSPAANVNQQLSGHTITRSDGDRRVFTIHAARTVSYQQSKSTVLEEVTVEVYGRKGDRSDILRTHRCEYDPQSGDFLSSGPVEIELSAHASDIPGSGLRGKHRVFLETSKVAYHQGDQLAETDEPVRFRMGPASGTALGLVYSTRDGWFKLKHEVGVDLPQGSPTAPQTPIHLTASSLRYDKEGGQVALSGPVEVTEGARRAESQSANIALDDTNRVSRVNLKGHARAFDVNSLRSVELNAERVQGDFDAASGQLRHLTAENDVVGESKGKGGVSRLTADRVEMDMGGKHPQPLQGVATGKVHINLESQPMLNLPEKTLAGKAPEKKTLTAAEVRFYFRPDTHSLKNAETVGPGTLLVSPADPKTGERVITAGQFLMTFDARSRIESLRGTAPTQVLFRPPATAPAGSPPQQSQADRLDAVFDVGTQTLREVVQTGNFQYRDGDRQASADDAHYDAPTQTMLLLGHPQVWDTNSRIKCQKITIDMPTSTSIGEGKVQAAHLPSPAPGAASTATPVLPTNVLADRMVARRQSQTVHYEGHVRAWQGTDVVESSSLDVYRNQKRVSSGSQVVTSYLQPAAMASEQGVVPHPTGETRPVTVHADFLEYFDQGRRARYHGNVRLVTESTTLQSDRLDVYFTPGGTVEGSEVDHAESDGHVKVTQPGRVGTGDQAEYYAGPGKIVLNGGPPILVDEKKGSTTGQRLTFFIHDDRLFVDGGDQSPSLSKHRVAP